MVAGGGPVDEAPTGFTGPGAVRLLCGPHGSGRPHCIDSLMRRHGSRAILLVPTRKYAQRRLETIILDGHLPGLTGHLPGLTGHLPGLWGRAVSTFEDFVVDLLRAEGKPPARVADFERRLLLQDALARIRGNPSLAAIGAAADTRGFVSQMLRVITEIKQAAVDPDRFRSYVAAARNPSWLDPVVADVYEAYQQALLDAGVYDVPGMFWEAAVVCRQHQPRRMENADALLLDGFDDFTPSEFNLLASLRPHVKLLVFGLNCDTDPNRSDLYAGPLRTAGRIEQEFRAVVENFEAPEPKTYAEYAAASIFWRDQPMPPPKNLQRDLEIIPCPDAVEELETVCRRIKKLLIDGTAAPGEIAVVYPVIGVRGTTVRAVFGEFGIPVRVLTPPLLWESSVAAFVLALLEAMDEWQRETVVDVLVSPWYLPGRPHVGAIPSLARAALITSGAEEWRSRLEGVAARIEHDGQSGTSLDRIPDAANALDALMAAVDALRAHDKAFPRQATAREFVDALKLLLHDLNVAEAVRAYPVAEIKAQEEAAFEALLHLLDVWRQWSRDIERAPRAAFTAEFRRALQEVGFHPPQPREAVVCLDAQGVRHLQFDYVFFAGVNEGELPGPPHISAVYSEQDIENLARSGIELEGRYAHIEREMLRFHHVLCSARKKLVISWRTLSPRGQEDHPSPYINDLLELFPAESLQAPMPRSTDFVPPLDGAFSWRDVRNAAFSAHSEDAAALRPKFPRIELAAQMETARHDTSSFGIYDGVLSDEKILEQLRTEFGPEHVFSVNQLETYAECPFRFFVERVLGIEKAEAPTGEFDAIVRGNILHDVLQKFHLAYYQVPASLVPRKQASAALDELIEEAFRRHARRTVNSPPAVVEVEKRHAKNLLLRYLHNERVNQETQWKPTHFEAAFGKACGESQCSVTVPQPFHLDLACGPILFAGRIDRIDLHDAKKDTSRIIDYKTSQVPQAKAVKEGRSLQLAVYALALEQLLMPDTQCAEAMFLSIGKNERRRLTRHESWDKCADLCTSIGRYVEGIRAARYAPAPADPDNACAYCSASRVCRYESGRIERKAQQDAPEEQT
ncbi:MAG TPA: PD-(D/E)XK nuclease family protein [Candidatus Bathyarchaeia archaeon]|nr:PD-(D/E)XK nuclease family protein [Candidatus Bathyarchaeia archaeon]